MSYFGVPQVEEGGQRKVVTQSLTVESLLLDILVELKMMNIYLSSISDIEVYDSDVEGASK